MTGPLKAAAALACLLGLAACGGGGGGGVAGGDPTTPPGPDPYFLERDAAAVATFNDAINTHAPNMVEQTLGRSRLSDLINHETIINSDGIPEMTAVSLSGDGQRTAIEGTQVVGNIYRFDTSSYQSGGKNYEGIVIMFYDPALTTPRYDYGGIWVRKETAADGTVSWSDFETAHTASYSEFDGDAVAGFAGTYTYTGEALGVYTKDGTSAGWFSADTELMVNFGGSDVPTASRFTMTGTIGNFVLSGQEQNNWEVTVSGQPAGGGGSGTPTNGRWNGTTDGGSTAGAFQARLFGNQDQVPRTINAEFNAHFTDGKVAGVFGGRRGN